MFLRMEHNAIFAAKRNHLNPTQSNWMESNGMEFNPIPSNTIELNWIKNAEWILMDVHNTHWESFCYIIIQKVAVSKLKFLSGISNLSASFIYGYKSILKGKPQSNRMRTLFDFHTFPYKKKYFSCYDDKVDYTARIMCESMVFSTFNL